MLNRRGFKAFQCNARSSTLMCRIQRNALFVLKCSDAECSEQSWMQHRWYCASWLLLTGHCALLLLLAIEGVLTTPSNMYNVSPTHHRTRFTAACTGMCCTVHLLHILSQSCASKLLKQISVKWFFPLAMMLWKYTQDDDEDDKRKWLSKPSFRQGPHFSIIRVCTVYEIIWVLLSDVISCIFHLCQSYFPREAKREMAMLSTSPPSPHSLVANPCPPFSSFSPFSLSSFSSFSLSSFSLSSFSSFSSSGCESLPRQPPSLNIGLALSPPPWGLDLSSGRRSRSAQNALFNLKAGAEREDRFQGRAAAKWKKWRRLKKKIRRCSFHLRSCWRGKFSSNRSGNNWVCNILGMWKVWWNFLFEFALDILVQVLVVSCTSAWEGSQLWWGQLDRPPQR